LSMKIMSVLDKDKARHAMPLDTGAAF
jgi:hypothetical protein